MQFWWVFLLLKFNFRWFFYKITFAVAWICKIRPNFKLDFFLIFRIFFGPSFGNWSTRKRIPQTCYKKTYSRSLIMWMIRLNQQKSDTMKNKIYENVLMLSHCAIPSSEKICPLIIWIQLSMSFICLALVEYFVILLMLRFGRKVGLTSCTLNSNLDIYKHALCFLHLSFCPRLMAKLNPQKVQMLERWKGGSFSLTNSQS